VTLETNAFTSYSAVGNREDLNDFIYNIAPTETPFINSVARTKATGVLHEWMTDGLADAAANRVLEGDVATVDAATATVRLSNTCQISDKVPRVTGTQEAVKKAGRASELGYQSAKRAKELKRDLEFACVGDNTAEITGNGTTARGIGAVASWIDTNTSNGSGGSDGSLGNTARTDGTQRDFTEILMVGVLQSIFDAGGNPDCVMLGLFNKRQASTFTGNATRQVDAKDGKLYASIDVYESDWGDIRFMPNRFSRSRDALILQKDMWAIAYLRPFSIWDIAKTGDTQARQLLVEWTLESRNEGASGAVWDLKTS
jgi:hypothetical protein